MSMGQLCNTQTVSAEHGGATFSADKVLCLTTDK